MEGAPVIVDERPGGGYRNQLEGINSSRQLRILNSFTKKKDPFVSIDEKGPTKTIKWYSCGPTVYDAAHLGHARSYISFDIIRRILQDYFGYKIHYVMNITDIDDKIIKKAQDNNCPFKDITQKYEQEFLEDMDKLNVLRPNDLPRVTEYIEKIGLYIKELESNGFAYRSGGSVYFDTNKFDSDPKHSYAKLVREAFGQNKILEEGEGELSLAQDKKSPNDFALWKKTKVGEPSWTTQDYEAGRPGWHIECSVMASDLLGENFDIHSGGCDLKFPHHDNEIAQAEAYYNTGNNWVNYFLHSGHLHISGCKMSKSLKNFITIQEALKDYTSRQLRFAFLAHSWSDLLDYSPNIMYIAISYEKTFKDFFLNVAYNSLGRVDQSTQIESSDDNLLQQEFMNAKDKVDEALCDNFDTRSVLSILVELVKECNKRRDTGLVLIRDITYYIKRTLDIFGACFDDIDLDKLFSIHWAKKFVEAHAQFRAEVRKTAISGITKAGDAQQCLKQILAQCDAVRDQTLPNLSIGLEDKEVVGTYEIKLVDSEAISILRALTEKREQEKRLKEETDKMEKLKLREDKAKMPPDLMFRHQTDKYSQFDDQGMPTHDFTGKEMSKSALKKLQRLYAEQEARYRKYIEQ